MCNANANKNNYNWTVLTDTLAWINGGVKTIIECVLSTLHTQYLVTDLIISGIVADASNSIIAVNFIRMHISVAYQVDF